MATIPIANTVVSYESHKLREVLLPRDVPLLEGAAADPPCAGEDRCLRGPTQSAIDL